MPIIFDNTQISDVVYNGTTLDEIIKDGVQVYKKSMLTFNVTAKTGWFNNGASHPTSEPTLPDLNFTIGERSFTIKNSDYTKGSIKEVGVQSRRDNTCTLRIPIYGTERFVVSFAGWYAYLDGEYTLDDGAYYLNSTYQYGLYFSVSNNRIKAACDLSEDVTISLSGIYKYHYGDLYAGASPDFVSDRAINIAVV